MDIPISINWATLPIIVTLANDKIYVRYSYHYIDNHGRDGVYNSLEEAQEAIRLWKIKEKL